MEADDFNSLYQKAFALALKSQAGVEQKDLDDGKSFFFPTKNTNTRILPASRHMPVALTNDYLFLEADYLYKPNEEYRQGTGSRSYVRRLVQYMRDARPADRDLTEEEKKKRRALREELEDAENDFLKAQEKAEARWQKEHDAKPSQTPDFSTWARANAAVFLSVHSDYRGIAARYSAFQIGILGDENWKREHDKLVQALNATEYSPR
ncbi:hypothetical protein BJY01DRAFT_256524 [Aspergillus pseudoustus]|uniref:Uncharacterized protein n=1 Tax=Aspergillus pseudoustus TaxID=1810923 RepID=A0ABR4IB59_9EURO